MASINPTKDYQEFLALVKNFDMDSNKADVYQALMEKEKNVLDVVNRVANQDKEKQTDHSIFYNMSLMDILVTLINQWRNAFRELLLEQHYQNIVTVLWEKEKKIYTGMTIVMLGLILFFIDVTS